MKKEYNLKDKVWIHIGEHKLVEGRVVDIFTLAHLKENHDPDQEYYVIEIKTGIDDIYEVRTASQISEDSVGPIGLFRHLKEAKENNRYLKKVGMPIPINTYDDDDEPTPEQISEALARSQELSKHTALNLQKTKPKKRYYRKKTS